MSRENWDKIIKEEISKMIDNLRARGVDADNFVVDIKGQNRVPEFKTENKDTEEFLVVKDLDELLTQIKARNSKKCDCCGNSVDKLFKVNDTTNVCESCKDAIDIYSVRIKSILKNKDKANKMLDCLSAVTEFLEMNTEDCEPEPTPVEMFVFDVLLESCDFESKDDIIDFLEDVIDFVESNDFEL